jgi:hypothetical protein
LLPEVISVVNKEALAYNAVLRNPTGLFPDIILIEFASDIIPATTGAAADVPLA